MRYQFPHRSTTATARAALRVHSWLVVRQSTTSRCSSCRRTSRDCASATSSSTTANRRRRGPSPPRIHLRQGRVSGCPLGPAPTVHSPSGRSHRSATAEQRAFRASAAVPVPGALAARSEQRVPAWLRRGQESAEARDLAQGLEGPRQGGRHQHAARWYMHPRFSTIALCEDGRELTCQRGHGGRAPCTCDRAQEQSRTRWRSSPTTLARTPSASRLVDRQRGAAARSYVRRSVTTTHHFSEHDCRLSHHIRRIASRRCARTSRWPEEGDARRVSHALPRRRSPTMASSREAARLAHGYVAVSATLAAAPLCNNACGRHGELVDKASRSACSPRRHPQQDGQRGSGANHNRKRSHSWLEIDVVRAAEEAQRQVKGMA